MRAFLMVLVTGMLLTPVPAFADFLSLAQFFHGTVGDNPSSIVFTNPCTFNATNAPLSESCSGSRAVGTPSTPGTGSFSGTAQTSGSSTGTLSLGSASSLDVIRVNPGTIFGSGDRYFASLFTTSTITDTVNFLGTGAVTDGFLRLTFGLDGSITEAVDPFSLDGFSPVLTPDTFFASGTGTLSINNVARQFTAAGPVVIDVPLAFGTAVSLNVSLLAFVQADILFSEGYRVNADFLNTATLTGASVLDANRQLIAGASMSSAGGYMYGDLTATPVAPVPEPSTLALLGLGLAAAVRRKVRR